MRRILLLVGITTLAGAQTFEAPARIGIITSTKITIAEVVERAVANDRDIEISRINRDEAQKNIAVAQARFDPILGLNASRNRSVSPQTSLITGAANGRLTQKSLTADPSLSGSFPILGGTYKLDFSQSRQSTDSTLVSLNPQFPVNLTLNLTQPLWRGMRYDDNRYRLALSRNNLSLSNEQFRQHIIEVVSQAIEAYWEVDFAYRNLEVQVQAVRLAQQQDASNRRQVEQGLLAPVDVVQTQTQVATFQQNVYAAQQALTQAENALKQIITADRTDLLWSAALIPSDPAPSSIATANLDDALKNALTKRPEIAENRISLEANELDLKLARERLKPQVDATATLSAAGLAGRALPPGSSPFGNLFSSFAALPAQYLGGYSQSLSNLATGSYPSASLGVQMSFPLHNRSAIAQAEVSALETRRLKSQKAQVEMAVEADVRNTLQTVASAQSKLAAATDARKHAEAQYASEQRQFQAGTSSVFLVLQRQTELISARSREVRAEADLGRAIAESERATASTIESHNIHIQ